MSSIIDNRDGNTLLHGLQLIGVNGRDLRIATAFFSLDALYMLADGIGDYERIRILFGDDASAMERRRLLQRMRELSDRDLAVQREASPQLTPLKKVLALFQAGRIEARCYTAKKFHAKAYLIERPSIYPPLMGVIGSGNFTRPGLTQNIELNVQLTPEQTTQLAEWFEARWSEAVADVVTEDILDEVRRQLELYDPYVLYLKALTLWGDAQEARWERHHDSPLMRDLDPHVEQGYRRAVKILERENGVMVCDGVGLGKSFVALALIERFCVQGLNVLLIAPKSILESSWKGYLKGYLNDFMDDFGNIKAMPMTDFGFQSEEQFTKKASRAARLHLFDPGEAEDDETTLSPVSDSLRNKWRMLDRLSQRIDAVVIDESHNFRTSSAGRYVNLMRALQPFRDRRKKVVLLTATPINTAYRDISNQMALMTHENGSLAGYSIEQIRKAATQLDKGGEPENQGFNAQLALPGLTLTESTLLNRVLESVAIQRSRKTVRELAAAVNKTVLFPKRIGPTTKKVTLGSEASDYRELIKLADQRFRPGVKLLQAMQAALEEKDPKKRERLVTKAAAEAATGIKLAAFLLEQYRKEPATAGEKTYRDEVHLARLVFANTLKQFECSPPAFQGIIQSLGLGLLARLQYVYANDEAATVPADVAAALGDHGSWVRTPIFESRAAVDASNAAGDEEAETDAEPTEVIAAGEAQDASGAETDSWLVEAMKSRGLKKKLEGFTRATHDIDRWKQHILSDLVYLKEIHGRTLLARRQPDPKLMAVMELVRSLRAENKKVLIFTQSQRTAQYLERELVLRLNMGDGGHATVARIDSHVSTTRAAILHAFSPKYNAAAQAPSIPKTLDILICTDVLSEGVNLQEADVILSYDIHWNPVRLIQRIGRVDRRLKPDLPESANKAFEIINVLPPDEVDQIINLVGTVENRTLRISNAVGLDVSFFKSDDPAGNLREFNAAYEGEVSTVDAALSAYARLSVEPPDAKTRAMLDRLPPGAFGVWQGAPCDGLFALFTLEPKADAPESDRKRFAAVIGRPILALEEAGKPIILSAGDILMLLTGTTPGAASGNPSDEVKLSAGLKRLKNSVRNSLGDMNLPTSILPRLVCWMELRR